MEDLDLNQIAIDMQKYIDEDEKEYLELHMTEIQDFISYSKTSCLNIPISAISYPYTIGIIVEHDDILSKLLTTLIADKEGLYSWTDINAHFTNKFANGFLYHKKFMAMLHPFFRRKLSQNANFAPGLVNTLMHDGQKVGQSLSIALDINRLRIDVDDTFYTEFDSWFGPKFYIKINKISDGPVKMVPPLGCQDLLYEYFFSNTKFLNILWTTQQNIREFQLEEVKGENIIINYCGKKYHPVRYVHAEYDAVAKCFRHLDGAVHLYTNDEYQIRIVDNLNINVKNFRNNIKPLSIKLFKINGTIPTDQFIQYCSLFLTHNPLIHEYFTGELPKSCADAVKKLSIIAK